MNISDLNPDEIIDTLGTLKNGHEDIKSLIFNLATSGNLAPQIPDEVQSPEVLKLMKKNKAFHESIPGWVNLRLADCAEIYNGNSTSATEKAQMEKNSTGLNYIATKDVGYGFEPIEYDTGLRIGANGVHFKKAQMNSILICLEGGSAGKKMGLLSQEVAFGNKLFAVVCKDWIQPKFILMYFLSNKFQSEFRSKMTGIIGGISKANFINIQIPIPPLAEQNRIIERVESLISICDSLKLAKDNQRSLIGMLHRSALEAITTAQSPEELEIAWQRIQENWGVIVGDLEAVDSVRKLILSLAARGKLIENPDRFSNATNYFELNEVCQVSWGNLALTKSSYSEEGEFLAVSAAGPDGRIGMAEHRAYTPVLSAIGARCGTMFMPAEDFTAIKNTMTLQPKSNVLDNWYLFYTLRGSELPRRGSAQPFMSKSDIEKFKIRVPSLEEQKIIASTVETLLEKCDLLESKLREADELADKFARSVVSASA